MVSRKRAHSEMETAAASSTKQQEEPSLFQRIRNCWEFASLMQYIFFFGKIMKIDEDLGVEDLEMECLKPEPSEKLMEIGLALLKFVSSHRGLTFDNFDEYTRRQYNAKAPHLVNPFGYDEEPNKFRDFDVFLKLKVLHQLSLWTFWNPDRIREKMPEQREIDQTQWRIEEFGWDSKDRIYYVLDDNRLYRRTDPAIPPPAAAKPKANSKKARAAARAAKRRRLSAKAEEENDEDVGETEKSSIEEPTPEFKWECLATNLSEYQEFIDSLQKTRDPNEKSLRNRLVEGVLPIVGKAAEAEERKRQKREKELFNMQLLAGAKRSSRLAEKQDKERRDREAMEAARKREMELAAARKEQEIQHKMEKERQNRIMTRERRIKERESKRILHEEEMARLEEEQKKLESGEGRVSERQIKAELDKRRKEMEELAEEDQWIFDCSGCGVHGENIDDGSHCVACERCNVWQHSSCLGISQDEAEKDDFHFVCADCKRKEEEASRPKIPPLKFRIGSASPATTTAPAAKEGEQSPLASKVSLPAPAPSNATAFPQRPALPPNQPQFGAPTSPERRFQPATNGGSFAAPGSPSKGSVGPASSPLSSLPEPAYIQRQQPVQHSSAALQGILSNNPLSSHRPSSSHSVQSQVHPSPIQNRPSMSPTQGNRDVGPLAGFPPSAISNGSVPTTPYGQHRPIARPQDRNIPSFPSIDQRTASFSESFPSHTPPPPGSQNNMSFSGLSPTKNNSPRPVTASSVSSASVLPPIHRLEPSPKLMGRSSVDAPIPPPVKTMTPEQEGRRQRENQVAAGHDSTYTITGTTLPPLSSWNTTPSQNNVQQPSSLPPLGPNTQDQNNGVNGH
ncbi:PHD finger domain protein, putative [Talaromyces stipitatus ATCC 10500]|uniref:PHD finger domain protein, putative n=1 Tax=Talaromyces stipitatus (strain ATCC 10500 / CBS 375.48 / QM 6759 / NRRL 1006) TaxID=441959 RepID=B8LWI6_TALSN|nr:PHD finger domain protein, putative [Talaromyces stipitatus ATCC 10500]EED24297.1 PHD finger domain protein, putative [Talaromyces stipitatus ATCC 10500]